MDVAFVKAASTYFVARAADPAYERRETSLLAAFDRMPRLHSCFWGPGL
jgi:hypothetical protein